MAHVLLQNGVVAGIFSLPQDFTTDLDDKDPLILTFLSAQAVPSRTEARVALGLQVTSTNTPALSSIYALDDLTLSQIGSVARDFSAGLGLPGGAPTFTYPDINSVPVTFTGAQLVALYKAMRDYMFSLQSALALGQPFPTNSATIP